jgi:DNA-binding XRE family transcriptional regulator
VTVKQKTSISARQSAATKSQFNTNWFKDQIKKAGISQRAAARIVGIHHASLIHMFNGNRRMPVDEARNWADLFNTAVEDIYSNAGLNIVSSEEKGALVDIKGWIDPELTVHWGATPGPRKTLNPLSGNAKNIGALRCQTAGGFFEGIDGAHLYFTLTAASRVDLECLNRLSLVSVPSKRHYVRVLKRGYESGKFNLALPNGDISESDVVLESATPILWMKL